MDFGESSSIPIHPSSQRIVVLTKEDMHITNVSEEYEAPCWGCGSQLILPAYAPVFKCGWCGAITNQNVKKSDNKVFWWRHLRDRCFVVMLVIFMCMLTGFGVWAVAPIVFSVGYFTGGFHCTLTAVLFITTLCTFSLAAFRSPGAPPAISWGSCTVVGKGALEGYNFCQYCLQPKSPKTHHCRSCRMCVLDMDHHCPIIGNCVGAGNHRLFIFFLICTVISTTYTCVMSVYAGWYVWPSLNYRPFNLLGGSGRVMALRAVQLTSMALFRSLHLLSMREVILVYLFVCSISVGTGLGVLLWQQMYYIYQGSTYLDHLSSKGSDEAVGRKDCLNVARFFGCSYLALRYLPRFQNSRKKHTK